MAPPWVFMAMSPRFALAALSMARCKLVVPVPASHVAKVVLEHHLIDPPALGRCVEDLGKPGVVAAQAAETGLTLLLEGLERGLHAGVAQQLDLVAGQSVQVIAVDMVGLEPLQAGV